VAKKILKPVDTWNPDPKKGWAFSEGVEASGKSLVFVSGQGPFDANGEIVARGDVKGQTRQTLENMKKVLEEAHCTLDDVVKVTVYLRRIADRPAVAEVRMEYFKQNLPASTLVGVELSLQDMLVEIEGIAVSED